MKIVIIAWRSWFVRRLHSLIVNARLSGHEVWGFAANGIDPELTLTAFEELGVSAYPQEEFAKRKLEIDPDVIIGLYYSGAFPLERWAQDWVTLQGKVGLLVNHFPVLPTHLVFGLPSNWQRTHLIVANQAQVNFITGGDGDRWPKERVHILGVPDFDFITEQVDVAAVRAKLGVAPSQRLIGIFPTSSRWLDFSELQTFMAVANQRGWKVAMHIHPYDRRVQYSSDPKAFYFPAYSAAAEYLALQQAGAHLVVSSAPGEICGVKFHLCESSELLRAADCLLVSSFDVAWESYVLGKRSHLLGSYLGFRDLPRPSVSEPFDLAFDRRFGMDNAAKVQAAFEHDRSFKPDPALMKGWIYGLDGLWWKRTLDLAQRLRK